MRQLDSEAGRTTEPPRSVQCSFQCCFIFVAVHTETCVRDAATPLDRCSLDDDEPGARVSELREVLQVPVGRRAVAGAVLAHRGDHETVRQLHFTNRDRLEQTAGHAGSCGPGSRRL